MSEVAPYVEDVTARLDDPELVRVLRSLAWRGTANEVEEIVRPYRECAGRLYALFVDGQPASTCGVCRTGDVAELRTVATRAGKRRLGYASRLIDAVVRELRLRRVWLETDDDAVDFYRSAGFDVESLGEKYPGVVRYRCTRSGVSA